MAPGQLSDTKSMGSSADTQQMNDTQQGASVILAARKNVVRAYFQQFIDETYYQLGVASEEETDRLRIGLRYIQSEEDIRGWEVYMNGLAERQRESARQLTNRLHAMLKISLGQRHISSESANRWIARYRDPSIGYKEKEHFIEFTLANRLREAGKIAKERTNILKNRRFKTLSSTDIARLAEFKDERKFLSLHFNERKNVLLLIKAKMGTPETLGPLYKKASEMLDTAVQAGAMSKNKVGKWMHSLFNTGRTTADIETILSGKLPEYIGSWTKTRYRYDRILREMEEHGVPPGFTVLPAHKFLDLDYPQRESYVEEAERTFQIGRAGPPRTDMDKMKMRIRSELAAKDWDSAAELIAAARKTAEGEDIHELDSMQRYLTQFRKGRDRQDQSGEAYAQIREVLAEVPACVQPLYIEAMSNGYDTFNSLTKWVWNRIWCWQHGYLNGDREARLYDQSVGATQDVLDKSYEERQAGGLENINLETVDENTKHRAMRPYEKTWAPTIVHADCGNGGSRAALLQKMAEDNPAENYWSTLIPIGLTYEKQLYLSQHVNWKLKSAMRKLQKVGLPFSFSQLSSSEHVTTA